MTKRKIKQEIKPTGHYCVKCRVKLKWHQIHCPYCGLRIWNIAQIALYIVAALVSLSAIILLISVILDNLN